MIDRFNAAPYYGLLGLSASSDAPGRARVALPFSPKLTQLYGGIHGGALLSLADAAINLAVATTFEHDETVASVSVTLDFLAPAGADDVEAEATVTRRGGRLAFAECVLRAGGREVARGRGVCRISKART
jgi:uncharacterized protein (TIGR00369 family)